MGPSLAVEGATIKEVFESYIEEVLAPTLREGQVMVMDNLTDFNPIEQAFSKKIKYLSREARARVYEALVEAIGKALWTNRAASRSLNL